MLAYDLALEQMLLAPQQRNPARDGGAPGADARAIEVRLRAAERVLSDDPDIAALLLDGVLSAIAALWLASEARLASPLQSSPLASGDAHFGLRLRLALRAPNVEARLAQCRDLLRLIAEDEGDKNHVG